jgi:hypothetical protein
MTLLDKYRLPAVEIRKEDLPSLDRGLTLLEAYTLWTQYTRDNTAPHKAKLPCKPAREWRAA